MHTATLSPYTARVRRHRVHMHNYCMHTLLHCLRSTPCACVSNAQLLHAHVVALLTHAHGVLQLLLLVVVQCIGSLRRRVGSLWGVGLRPRRPSAFWGVAPEGRRPSRGMRHATAQRTRACTPWLHMLRPLACYRHSVTLRTAAQGDAASPRACARTRCTRGALRPCGVAHHVHAMQCTSLRSLCLRTGTCSACTRALRARSRYAPSCPHAAPACMLTARVCAG